MTINETQDEIIEEFTALDDWMDRYQMLIDLGEEQAPLADADKTEQNLIDGCQSRVWIVCEEKDGKLHFRADSDALIVKGLVALVLQVVNDHRPDEIYAADLYFIERIGLRDHLSPTRSNGLLAMVKQIRMYALAMHLRSRPRCRGDFATSRHPFDSLPKGEALTFIRQKISESKNLGAAMESVVAPKVRSVFISKNQ